MDGGMDRDTDVQCESIIPCHYRVAGYKKYRMSSAKTLLNALLLISTIQGFTSFHLYHSLGYFS